VGVLLSTSIQATHFCAFRGPDTQTSVELSPASSGTPVCLTCLMAPSINAIIFLVSFFFMFCSSAFVGGLQMRPKPILNS
jgi:hypothetical protein